MQQVGQQLLRSFLPPPRHSAGRCCALCFGAGCMHEFPERRRRTSKVTVAGVGHPLSPPQVLDWFKAKGLEAYSISCGQSLLYNNIFPKHKVAAGAEPACPPALAAPAAVAGLRACSFGVRVSLTRWFLLAGAAGQAHERAGGQRGEDGDSGQQVAGGRG